MTTPDKQSPNFIVRLKTLASALNEQLRPQTDQPHPFQRTTFEEDLARVNEQSGPVRTIDEIFADFTEAAQEIHNNHWPFPRL
jgi:hypothetical protein